MIRAANIPAPRCADCGELRGILTLDRRGALHCERCSTARNDFDAGDAQRHATEGRTMPLVGALVCLVSTVIVAGCIAWALMGGEPPAVPK